MRTEQIKRYLEHGLFAACPSYMEGVIATVNSGEIAKETIIDVSPSHSYETFNNVAVISVDGAMTKKNTWINAMCGGFTSYDILSQYIAKAESNDNIDTILFNVDTAGGEVAGADEVGELIFSSSKKTVTFYNNLGASAGVWIFSASKEIYANRTAMIGSIGVMAGYREPQEDGSIVLVSRNAQNKNCSLTGDCKQKIQARIDDVEAIFYERVMRNTGLSAKEIAGKFDYGNVISAAAAKEAGFVKEITTFDALLKSLQTNLGLAVPSVSVKHAKLNIGADMKFDRDDLDATEANFNALVQNRITLQGRNEALTVKLENIESALEAKDVELQNLTATLTSQLSEAEGKVKAEIVTRVEEAVAIGANAETIVAMVQAGSPEEASKIAIEAKESSGASIKVDENTDAAKTKASQEYAIYIAKKHSV